MDVEFRLKRLEAENLRLRRAVEELSVLNEVALAVSSTSALDEVVDLIVQKCVKHLRVEQGAVLMLDEQEAGAPLQTMVRKVQADYAGIPYRLGDQITGWMLKNQQPLAINDLAADGRFRLPPEASSVKSLLCVPLRLKGKMVGVLSVFNKRGGEEFGESDQRLLTIIAAQSAQVIESVRLYEEELKMKRIEQELDTARDIQVKLLPKGAPLIPGYDLAARSQAARQVGGDSYDFLEAGEGRVALCLADVSGKGISASLLMANVQATIRTLSLTEEGVASRLARANKLLHESTDSDKFVTMFYGQLDSRRNELVFCNAGHNPPVLVRPSGSVERLEIGGPVLGVLPSFHFQEATAALEPGSLLLIFSDGFSEAMNPRLEEFGEERLIETARLRRDRPAAETVELLFRQVLEFCGDAPQTDDMTAMVLRRVE
ncbi:MAG: SpoIIE family protein phosphatase [Acidobacteria bacterium]|nr:SpoIIE family protein phosphatase [Acidobacteriota bacterium]